MSASIGYPHQRYGGTSSTNPFQAVGGAVVSTPAYRSSKNSIGNSPSMPLNNDANRGQIQTVQWRFG